MIYDEFYIDPKDIFNSIDHIMEDTAPEPDTWGNLAKEYRLNPEELTTANIYLNHFMKQPADAITLHWEIPSKKEAGNQLIPHDMAVQVHHSIGKLTTFFTFLKSHESTVIAHKSFHLEEDERKTKNPDFPTSDDFIVQHEFDSRFKKIEEKAQAKSDIKGIKIDEMRAIRALVSSLYKV